MNKIEKAIKVLLDTKPFYAHFFLNSKVLFDKYDVKTAAAGVTKDSTVLIFNTQFINNMTPENVAAIVEHEVLHILFEHTHEMAKKSTGLDPHVANIAMDLAINQYIQNLPEGGVTLEGMNKMTKLNLEPKQTWQYYYGHLIQKKEQMGKYDTIDDHTGNPMDLPPGEVQKVIMRTTIDKSIKCAKGNVPAEVMTIYDALGDSGKVPWQHLLANFIGRHSTSVVRNTRKKANRRYGFDQPGKKKKKELVLGVCVDSSGSVSDEAFQQFLAEIVRLTPLCYKTHVIDADCVVQDVVTVKKNSKMQLKRVGRGGTAYQPAIDKCMEMRCDIIVYFGDFDTADTPTNPGVPFLWVGVGNSPKPGDFGYEIRL